MERLNPVWEDNYVTIAANCSNQYAPYLSVYLESIKAMSTDDTNYDVIILHKSITEENQHILKSNFEVKKNLSLRFFNPEDIFTNANLHVTHYYLCEESYYRLAAAIIFQNYKKIIFTDIDLIFNQNPKELYQIDMKNAPIMATLEPVWSFWINNESTNIIKYTRDILKLKNPHYYFNTGVMLMNIEELNKNNYTKLLLDKTKNEIEYLYQDQDILNEVLAGKIGVLPFEWNFEIIRNKVIEEAHELFKSYCNVKSENIIHWIGADKPWLFPNRKLAYLWWQYARKTPYYEIILDRLIASKASVENQFNRKINYVINYRKNVLQYWKCKVLSKITFGKKHQHYKDKRKLLKNKIWIAKNIKNNY